MKVLVCDPIGREGIKIMEKAGLEVEILDKSSTKLENVIAGYEGLIVRSQTKVTGELISLGRRLKVIVRAGTGMDNIDMEAASVKGIKILNTPGANTNAAAEHTLAMMLAMLRNIPQGYGSLKAGKWDRESLIGEELSGKTVGIIGFGRIGRRLAEMLKPIGCRLLACDTQVDRKAAAAIGAKLAELDETLAESDIITLHVPLTESTRHMIGRSQLVIMKRGSYLVNCARGGLIDEGALFEALESGRLKGAAIDVFETEPPAGSRLLSLSNVIFTPHLGASTLQAKSRVAAEAAEAMANALMQKSKS